MLIGELLNGKNGYYPMDKRIAKKDDANYREELVPFRGGGQRIVVSKNAYISKDAIKVVSSLVSNILLSIKEYLDYCEKTVVFETEMLLTIK